MIPIQLPRFSGNTPEDRTQQMENAFYMLVEQINQNLSILEKEINESKGNNDGTV